MPVEKDVPTDAPVCPKCGNLMQRTGVCYTCPICGHNDGCGMKACS